LNFIHREYLHSTKAIKAKVTHDNNTMKVID